MKYKVLILLLSLILCSKLTQAAIKKTIIRETILKCEPSYSNGHRLPVPHKFQRSNNLLKKPNDMFFAKGKPIIIEGYILDKNCVPITNAIVKLWQVNNFGLNQNTLKARNLTKDLHKLNKYESHFIGNGVTSSDNTGYYRFISLYPEDGLCDNQDCAKDFDLMVTHNRFSNFNGNILISAKSPVYNAHIADFVGCRNEMAIYRFDIVLEEKSHYRKY